VPEVSIYNKPVDVTSQLHSAVLPWAAAKHQVAVRVQIFADEQICCTLETSVTVLSRSTLLTYLEEVNKFDVYSPAKKIETTP
jgi:hypothetical protein